MQQQTFTDFEVVLINDGKQDITDCVSESGLAEAGIAMNLLTGPTKTGPAAARNRGLAEARGQVIAYLDDDDLYSPDHLAVHAKAYENAPHIQAVYSDAERTIVTEDRDHNISEETEVVFSREYSADDLLAGNYIPTLCMSHRRECLEKTGGFEESLSLLAEWDLFIRLAMHTDLVHIAETTGRYFEQGTGSSVQEYYAHEILDTIVAIYMRNNECLEADPERKDRIWGKRLRHMGQVMTATGAGLDNAGPIEEAYPLFIRASETEYRGENFLALARIHQALGRVADAMETVARARGVQSGQH
ncbi:glycosyl transferase [Pseudodesulfovibrio sediminis]|uniref:Glycosyl transferase n=1 Tax=Pseudodesulfovibrio sediminis TaxID=2810563 RepID=A0ABN6ERZ6_9BACT|nr:glycosyl transferase [Pseudodesulfovibrio sediminis]